MQLRLPWSAPRVTGPAHVTIGGRAHVVRIVRHRGARRFVLRMGHDGALKLTVPRGAAIADGLAFVAKQGDFIAREDVRIGQKLAPWRTGTEFLFRGSMVTLTIRLDVASFAGHRVKIVRENAAASVKTYMLELARTELPERCLQFAARHALTVSRVVIRNQRSRWGSCASSGTIALNWRLIQMPQDVADYVILHELMHLRQGNHSRRFWKEVEAVCPAWQESERWLRKNGRQIL